MAIGFCVRVVLDDFQVDPAGNGRGDLDRPARNALSHCRRRISETVLAYGRLSEQILPA